MGSWAHKNSKEKIQGPEMKLQGENWALKRQQGMRGGGVDPKRLTESQDTEVEGWRTDSTSVTTNQKTVCLVQRMENSRVSAENL